MLAPFLIILLLASFRLLVSGYHAGTFAIRSNKSSGLSPKNFGSFLQQGAFDPNLLSEDIFHLNCSVPICDGELSEIYCTGQIIAYAWFFGFHETCPGSKLKFEPETVILNFNSMPQPPKKEDFKRFCVDNFDLVPYLKPAVLVDWKEVPKLFPQIQDPKMRKLAMELNNIWPQLSREFVVDVHDNPNRYPVVPVPNRFIIPGGLFQVYFYWDTYWILKGVIFSEMFETARGVLENFAHILKYKDFIPNSGNLQLSKRSQPPLFTQMIWDFYLNFQGDRKAFLKEFLPVAEKELNWWQKNRAVIIEKGGPKKHTLYQYKAETNCPRPENFLQDYQLGIQSGMDTKFYWSSTASACESGLDFSSRWFNIDSVHSCGFAGLILSENISKMLANRKGIETNRVVPVDLNVFMATNYMILASLYGEELGDRVKSEAYVKLAKDLQESINVVFLDEESKVWFDYDLGSKKLRKNFYPSNIYPLLLNTTDVAQCSRIVAYLKETGVFGYKGGIPSSLERNGTEQWDYPNAWAPSNHLFVESLLNCPLEEAHQFARTTADRFLKTIYNGLLNPIKGIPAQVWEKYDVRYDDGRSGFGGEYPVQAGFGWTNGAALDFIRMFYIRKDISVAPDNASSRKQALPNIFAINELQTQRRMTLMVAEDPVHVTIVLSVVAFCVGVAILYLYVHFVHNNPHRRPSSASLFWNSRRFDSEGAGTSNSGENNVGRRRNPEADEHRLLLNTTCDDDSSGNSD